MIPSTSERSIRDCENTCVFFNYDEAWPFCNLRDDIFHGEGDTEFELNRGFEPCPYNFTKDEMMEMVKNYIENK